MEKEQQMKVIEKRLNDVIECLKKETFRAFKNREKNGSLNFKTENDTHLLAKSLLHEAIEWTQKRLMVSIPLGTRTEYKDMEWF